MPARMPYADALRVLGRVLDTAGAKRARLIESKETMILSWATDAERWESFAYRTEGSLDELRRQARRLRGGRLQTLPNKWEEELRTLGQTLDGEGVACIQLTAHHRFTVTTRVKGRRVQYTFSSDELRIRSSHQSARRTDRATPIGGWWRRLSLRRSRLAPNPPEG